MSKPNLPVHQSDETYIGEIYQSAKYQEVYEAILREINSWRKQNVHEKVPNKGQQTISVRLVSRLNNLFNLCTHLTLRQHSSKENKSKETFFSFHQKKPTTFCISKNAFTD